MKRQFRQLNDMTKLRISQSLRGRSMSETHKQAISDSMKAYWATIPNKPTENMGRITKRFFNDDGQNGESYLFISSYE